MNAAISISHLSILFTGAFKALDDISLDLPAGKITGLIGPSGAGKTTLIRVIVGRQAYEQGVVTVLGLPAGSHRLRRHVSYMTQETSVYPDLTVRQNLRYFAAMLGVPQSRIKSGINEVLRCTDMTAKADHLVSSLSGGQKRRVSLAVAVIGRPKLMVLDEPTVGLDPVLREQVWALFRTIAAQGTTIIISSHVMDEAERCDDLVLIRGGAVLAHEAPSTLCRRTNTQTIEQSFLSLVGDRS